MNTQLENEPNKFDFLSFMDINRVHFFKDDKEIEELEKFYQEYFDLKKIKTHTKNKKYKI